MKIIEVNPHHLAQLNAGIIETKTLVEALAMDLNALGAAIGISNGTHETSILKRMKFFGEQMQSWEPFATHPSDTVRGFAAYCVASKSNIPFIDKLELMKTFANDSHFGVREWAWLSMRNEISANLHSSLKYLQSWTTDASPNIRRFAVECTRPRGVWCTNIAELKSNPSLGQSLLLALQNDESRYVQDSVANWLNDAYKSQPQWVEKFCASLDNSNKNAQYIVRRALRSKKHGGQDGT